MTFYDGDILHKGAWNKYGSAVKEGDEVTIQVDMDAHTLSYLKNGENMGVALRNLPSEGVWMCVKMCYLSQEIVLL